MKEGRPVPPFRFSNIFSGNKMKNKIRTILQSVVLLLILYVAFRPRFDKSYVSNFEAYCPFGGLSSMLSKLNLGSMSCSMSEVQVMMGIGLVVGVILLGKLFCSFLCPVGSVSEWLGNLGKKMHIKVEIPKGLDRPLRALKYILLFITLYFTMTSSELFCKEFEPYFASVNLFDNPDIALYFAIPAFIITIAGAIVFRFFWCKYLCPLGALSNIFLNVIPVGAAILLYIAANAMGAGISLVWLVAVIVLIGLLTEVIGMRSYGLPLTKITRNEQTCTNCHLCEKKCPQGIKITEYKSVNHIDCTLCTDCIYSCPVRQSLSINKKPVAKYIPPIATILLIVASLGFSSSFEFTTISERWGNFDKVSNLGVYERENLKSVKCFGSATSLKNQIEKVDGIVGIDAYASSHKVTIFYDKSKLNEEDVKAAIFSPVKQKLKLIKKGGPDSLALYQVGVYELFDAYDFLYFSTALKADKGVYGYDSRFGEPVLVNIYYDPKQTNPAEIKHAILVKKIKVKLGQAEEMVDLKFKIYEDGVSKGFIGPKEYAKHMFKIYDDVFNDYEKADKSKLSVLIYPMPEADMPLLRRKLSYLVSHLSNNKAIVRFHTEYDNGPKAYIYFDASMTTIDEVKNLISSPKMKVTFTGGRIEEVENPFKSKPEGPVKKAAEVAVTDSKSNI